MADNILRLKVESSEYDAKLANAAKGIRHLADVAHQSGGELTGLEKAELDYVNALGEMETKSRTAAGSVRELESTYKELKVIYDQLNDVEKQDEGGKALAKSLEQLKQRAQDAKKSLDDASKSLQKNEDAAKQDSSTLEKLASKFTLNIDALKLFDMGLSATKAALDVAKDAFFASEANVDEWGRTVASSQSLYEGFLTAINNGDISGYLSNIDSIVNAARLAYDELDKLGTMKTIQAPQISKQQLENERIRSMIQTGRYIAPEDGRKNAVFNGREMQTGDKLTAGQIRALEKQLQGGMQKVVKLVGNEVDQTGKAINAYYDKLAKTNGMSLQEFKKGTSSWDEFSKRMQGYEQYKEWDKQARTEYAKQGGRGNVDFDKNNPFAEFRKWGTFRVDKEGDNSYKDLVALIQQRDQQTGQLYSTQAQAYRTMNRAEGFTVSKLMRPGSGGRNGKGDKQEQTELQQNQKKINDLTQQYVDLSKQGLTSDDERLVKLREEIKELEKRNGLLSMYAEQAQGRLLLKDEGINREGIRRTKNNDLGLADGFDPSKPTQLSDKALKAVQKSIDKQTNLQAKELKDQEKQKTTVAGGLGDLAGGLNSIVGGLEQLGIEIPSGLKDVIGGMQTISSILTGIAATVIAIQTITTADALIPIPHSLGGIVPKFSSGGLIGKAADGMLIPGNFMSGDRLRMPVDGGRGLIGVNSGELILSRSQQNNLANALTGGGMSNMRLEAVVSGEQLLLVQNNRGLRTGRGELVQSKRRR